MSGKTPGSKKDPKDLRFEEAIDLLETILEQIESGNVGLEESLAQYEKGMKLISRCRALLSKAEQRIAELTGDEKEGLSIRENQVATERWESNGGSPAGAGDRARDANRGENENAPF